MGNQTDFKDVDVPRKSLDDATPQEWDEVRMNTIGQNGNDGEHYDLVSRLLAKKVADDDKATEKQIGGDHYLKHTIQPWEIIDDYMLDFYEGNVLKYLLRTKGDRVEDLQKAKHYLEKLIELESGDE